MPYQVRLGCCSYWLVAVAFSPFWTWTITVQFGVLLHMDAVLGLGHRAGGGCLAGILSPLAPNNGPFFKSFSKSAWW